jgi:alkylhydroperoxidase family enzyme
MARISLSPRRTLLFRLMEWYSRRAYGKVLDPGKAMAHHPRVLWSTLRFEQSLGKWHRLDEDLKALAQLASAGFIGCSWCMDFGYWIAHEQGIAPEKLRDLPTWQESEVYTPRERDVIAYAEAMSATPPEVSDDLAGRLCERLGEAAFVELTALVAVENLRSRMNSAFGLTGQGFKEICDLRDRRASGTAAGGTGTG